LRHYPLKIACLPISPRRLENSILTCFSTIFQCSNCAITKIFAIYLNHIAEQSIGRSFTDMSMTKFVATQSSILRGCTCRLPNPVTRRSILRLKTTMRPIKGALFLNHNGAHGAGSA
jgi:hypothetical protein